MAVHRGGVGILTMYTETIFWPVFEATGMLTDVEVVAKGTARAIAGKVLFRRPDQYLTTGTVSREFAMEYQHADFPALARGDQVLIATGDNVMRFEVRENPTIEDGNPTGFFRVARLSRVLA